MNKMKEFNVKITERLERTVSVFAESREDAQRLVQDRWKDSEYILDAESFVGVSCDVVAERNVETERISALLVQPDRHPRRIEMGAELEDLQKAVGGMIEAVYPYEDHVALIVNDEGKLNGLPLNRALRTPDGEIYDAIAGDFLVVGLGIDDFASLSPELMDKYEALFHQPEIFVQMGDALLVRRVPDHMVEASEKEESALDPEQEVE